MDLCRNHVIASMGMEAGKRNQILFFKLGKQHRLYPSQCLVSESYCLDTIAFHGLFASPTRTEKILSVMKEQPKGEPKGEPGNASH
jgi:hypothetical protein